MNCERAEQLMIDYLYGELSPEERQAFERHLQDCPEHAREVEKLSGVLNLVREQKPEEVPEQLSDRILHLAKAAAEQQTHTSRRPWALLLRSPVAAAAILVGVIITVGLAITQLVPDREKAALQEYKAAEPVAAPPAAPAESPAVLPTTTPKALPAAGAEYRERKPAPEKAAADKEYTLRGKSRVTAARKKPRRPKRSRPAPRAKKKKEGGRGLGGHPAPTKAEEKKQAAKGHLDFDDSKAEPGRARAKSTDGAPPGTGAAERNEAYRFATPPPPATRRPAARQTPAKKPRPAPSPEPAVPPVMEDDRPVESETMELQEEESGAVLADELATSSVSRASRKDSSERRQRLDLYQQAEGRLSEKNYARALSAYRGFLSQSPGDPRATTCRYRIAKTLFLMGRCSQAIQATRQAVKAAPRHGMAPAALLDQASCHIRLNQFEKAREVYRRIESSYPAYAEDARQGLRRIEGK